MKPLGCDFAPKCQKVASRVHEMRGWFRRMISGRGQKTSFKSEIARRLHETPLFDCQMALAMSRRIVQMTTKCPQPPSGRPGRPLDLFPANIKAMTENCDTPLPPGIIRLNKNLDSSCHQLNFLPITISLPGKFLYNMVLSTTLGGSGIIPIL